MDHKGIDEAIVHLKNELCKIEEEARILKSIINNLQLEIGINPEYPKTKVDKIKSVHKFINENY
jgi:hypothetical protein